MSEQENLQPVTAEEAKATGKTKKSKQKKPWQREVLEWVITLSVAVVLALTVRTFLFELVRVDGASMNPTLKDGEIMFVSKPCYVFGGNPERFDIVICHYPDRGRDNFVKRVVAVPGDSVYREGGVTHVVYSVPSGSGWIVLGARRMACGTRGRAVIALWRSSWQPWQVSCSPACTYVAERIP